MIAMDPSPVKVQWKDIKKVFTALNHLGMTSENRIEMKLMRKSPHRNSFRIVEMVQDLVIDKVEERLREKVVPEFWQEFNLIRPGNGFSQFKTAVHSLYENYKDIVPVMQKLEELRKSASISKPVYGQSNLKDVLKLMIRSTLQSQLPTRSYKGIIDEFYRLSFKVFYSSDNKTKTKDANESAEDNVHCGGCEHDLENCQCEKILEAFHQTNRILIEFELLERLAGEVITGLIQKRIESHVEISCKGSYDVSFLAPLENWLNTVVVGWLTHLYSSGPDSPPMQSRLNTFKRKLIHLLYETYTKARIEQLFNIIIEYPDSEATIEDLKVCLQKTELKDYLSNKLQKVLRTKLLHPGVNTPDIITAYVSAIRALRHLDPSGILLETVTQPVRQYLRGRDDTMKCVVTSLTDEAPEELADELVRADDHLCIDVLNWKEWKPDPIDAHIETSSERPSGRDIVSMLVTVYGSKEMFVSEYRKILADRLLLHYSFNVEKEIRYLELLKLRLLNNFMFEDSQLHYCEVMLKDINDSKRLNTHLYSEPNFGLANQAFTCTCMVLSAQFWPQFKEDKGNLELPVQIKEHLDIYTKAFETLKGNRTLTWKPNLGSVEIEIELKGKTLNFTLTPTQTAIIWHYQERNEWTIEDLSAILKVPPTVLRRSVAFWQTQGLLRETTTDTFVLVEDPVARPPKTSLITDMICEDDETESIMASAEDQREEELQAFWTYIVAMLGNLESLPPERMHQMLKMFASQGPSAVECTLQQLREFLDRKVREHKLLYSGGYYRLPK